MEKIKATHKPFDEFLIKMKLDMHVANLRYEGMTRTFDSVKAFTHVFLSFRQQLLMAKILCMENMKEVYRWKRSQVGLDASMGIELAGIPVHYS